MWLAGRLVPDHKTIADFRKDNRPAIRKVCAQFVAVCREIGLLTKASVAIDGSKFKAVNNRDKNFTCAKMERRLAQIEESVARYLGQLATADLQEPTEALAAKTAHLKEKLAKLATEMQRLKAIEKEMLASPAQQISLTDPDSRSMATSGRGSGVVGYNVQVAVDTEHHLIVTHEVTNTGSDRSQLAKVASQAKDILGADHLDYRCPVGEKLDYRYTNEEDGKTLRRYSTTACPRCPLKSRCTTGPERRITRWQPAGDAGAPRDSRASLRYAQDADGGDPLSDEAPAEGCHRDGPARARLQSHPGHEHCRCPTAPGGDEGIVASLRLRP
jgi:hypothetical protein